MHSLRKTIVFVFAIASLALVVFPVAAQIAPIEDAPGDFKIIGGRTVAEAEVQITRVINIVLGFVGLVALIILIYGGFLYITSLGDDSQTEKAKKTILFAIIGLIVIGLAAAIVNFVITNIGSGGGPPVGGTPKG